MEKSLKKWIKALRSGKYKQTKRKLQDNIGYCCLGVACKELIKKPRLFRRKLFGYDIRINTQPNADNFLLNISSDFYEKTGNFLEKLNDEENLSFDEIADCLELVYIHKILN